MSGWDTYVPMGTKPAAPVQQVAQVQKVAQVQGAAEAQEDKTPQGTSTALAAIQTRGTMVVKAESERFLSDDMGIEIVNIKVGPEGVDFCVHKKLLASSCEFFQKLFAAQEVPGGFYTLRTVLPVVFNMFIDYLYRGKLPSLRSSDGWKTQVLRLVNIVHFLAFLEELKFDRLVVDKLLRLVESSFQVLGEEPRAGFINTVYNSTRPGSTMRKWAASKLLLSLTAAEGGVASVATQIKKNDNLMEDFLGCVKDLVLNSAGPALAIEEQGSGTSED